MADVLGGAAAFIRDSLAAGPTLVCPLRVLWREYEAYCGVHGFKAMMAPAFVDMLESLGAAVVTRDPGTSGRLRRYVRGIGFNGRGGN